MAEENLQCNVEGGGGGVGGVRQGGLRQGGERGGGCNRIITLHPQNNLAIRSNKILV